MPHNNTSAKINFFEPSVSHVGHVEGWEEVEGVPVPAWVTGYAHTQWKVRPPFVYTDSGGVISLELELSAARDKQVLRVLRDNKIAVPHRLPPSEPNIYRIDAVAHEVEVADGVRRLENKIRFLESQLEAQAPYRQLYRLGAGSLFLAVISLVAWLLTGIGIPFHPIFAAGVVPSSLAVIAMAFLVRGAHNKPK